MLIDKRLIRYNLMSRRGATIRYIVVHDTGNPDAGADALAHYRYFGGGNRQASAHYFVDDKGVVQVIEDAFASWHCGDGRGKYGITNSNSIGIELCINRGNDRRATLAHARELIRSLMAFYRIPRARVVRHYDASRKRCPGSMAKDNWGEWWGFWESL
ncbi:MAG: peptidoglycan recognition family protein [Peptoniphilus sp.]|nr:peptidoglycan recognition family protein [Peptoniphilus sp.]MDY6045089.1 peptidoglycan recognition family protein [Peptoniphilus sp.]